MRFIFFTLVLLAYTTFILAQNESDSLETTNFTMPSSPAFDLLGISPSEIHKPGLPRDFQINWLIRNGGLDPNLAIEAEPVWLFYNRNKSLKEYRRAGWLFQTASSLNFSVGTAKVDNQQSLAYGLKLNLYNAKNALLDDSLIKQLEPKPNGTYKKYGETLLEFEITEDANKKDSLQIILQLLKVMMNEDSINFAKQYSDALLNWEKENWNATMVDFGFGQIFNYNLPTIFELVDTSTNVIDSLTFNNKAHALWLSGIFGIGNSGMINAMIKYLNEGENDGIIAGLNGRYGNEKINAYIEYTYHTINVMKNNIAYGLDYRMDNGIVVQASLKTRFNNKFKLKQLVPTINFAYQPKMKRR